MNLPYTDTRAVMRSKEQAMAKPFKPTKLVRSETDVLQAAIVVALPQLSRDQDAVFERLREQIIQARQSKGLEFLKHIGKLVVDGIWNGDASQIDNGDAVFQALCKDPEIKVSQSNLWYALQLQDPELLFGEAAKDLLPSHQKRLLHVPEERRKDLAQLAVDQRLTVEQLEDKIRESRAPAEGQKVRGAKPLPTAAKRFSSLAAAADKFDGVSATDLSGLTEEKARAMHKKVQSLRQLFEEWLPEFEAELIRIGKLQV